MTMTNGLVIGSRHLNLGKTRKRAIIGGAALGIGLLGSSGAWAQCTDNFNTFASIAGKNQPVQNLVPLGTGTALNALSSTINTVNTAFLTSTSAFVSSPGGPQPDQQGGGVWGRTIAGSVDTSSSSVGTVLKDSIDFAASHPGFVNTGTQNCHTTAHQDYTGYQVGQDISILNGGGTGANWHFGATAGYINARTTDTTPAGSYVNPFFGPVSTPAGSFSENSQVPFVGLYSAFTKGNLALDGQVRWDFYQNSLSDPINGLANQRLDARGFSMTGNAAYNIPLGNRWFIEPSAGAVWSRVTVDPLSVSGQANAGGTFAGGTVTVQDIDSILGRATLSVGTSFTNGPVTWQPFFSASVFHEFAGDVTASSLATGNVNNTVPVTQNNGVNGLTLGINSQGGLGTYGQFALGTAAVLGNSGWLGYGRVDYRIGENIEGWSVNAGLRYQFSPGTRGSIKDGPVPTLYSYNWTGPYIGLYAGTDWGVEHWSFNNGAGPALHPDLAGTMGGGQAGYNIQVGHYVFGIEGEYGVTNAHGGVACPNMNFYTCEADSNRLGMLTGRLGVTWGRALFYAKAGLAAGEVTAGTKLNPPTNPFGPLFFAPTAATSNWQVGWTIGGGMEFALTDRWSAKAEYMHYELGSDTFTTFVSDPGTRVDTRGDTVRVGVNLHFNPVQREVSLK